MDTPGRFYFCADAVESGGMIEQTLTLPPRMLTVTAARRAWMEPRVRFWWMSAIVLLGLGAAFTFEQSFAWYKLRSLVRDGLRVEAKIVEIEGFNRGGRLFPASSNVKLSYAVDGREYTYVGPLEGRAEPVSVDETITLRVNPDDPENWTLRTETIPIGHYLIGGILMLPVTLVGLVAAFVQRVIVVRAWKNNPAFEMKVIDTRQSPLAPRSRLLRCTPGKIGDLRVIYIYLPRTIDPGESIWAVPLGPQSSHALAIEAFEKR